VAILTIAGPAGMARYHDHGLDVGELPVRIERGGSCHLGMRRRPQDYLDAGLAISTIDRVFDSGYSADTDIDHHRCGGLRRENGVERDLSCPAARRYRRTPLPTV